MRRGSAASSASAGATESSELGAVAGARPAADAFMYVCGDGGGGPAPRYECFEPAAAPLDQPFDEHMFAEFGKERQVQVVLGASGELHYREELPYHAPDKRKEPMLLPPGEPSPAPPPPAPVTQPTTTTTTAKKSDKKKNDNNGIKKKKTR